MTHPIPTAALDDRLGFVGTAGSGKTYGAGTAVERLLARGDRVVIPDPLGVWWGLRLVFDGKNPSPYDVVIFGGPHGDLPITEHAGALIGETVAGMKESAIIDLSALGTKAAERRFMLAFLTAFYRKATKDPVHVVFDEADLWAPQQIRDRDQEPAKLLGMMETIVRRGRVSGFIPWLITQRPAVVNKDVLSQVDGLVAFKLTSTQDRKALGDWIEGQADREEGKRILGGLPAKQIGEAVVWIPARGVLTDSKFPPKATYDSSRTPKRGEKRTATELKPLDLGALKERLSTVDAEVKANDPKALRSEIARLTKELSGKGGQLPDPKAIEQAEQRSYDRGYNEGGDQVMRGIANLAPDMSAAVSRAESACADVRRLLESFSTFTEAIATERPKRHVNPPPKPVAPRRVERPSEPTGDLTAPLQKIVDAIRWWNVLGISAPSHPQAAFVAGYSHKSGTWATYLSKLRSMNLVEGRGDLALTDAGTGAAHEPDAPPNGDRLRAMVLAKLDAPLVKILSPIIGAYPSGLTHADAADAAGYSAQSGTWATYLSRLRSLDLIEGRGELKAQGWMFP